MSPEISRGYTTTIRKNAWRPLAAAALVSAACSSYDNPQEEVVGLTLPHEHRLQEEYREFFQAEIELSLRDSQTEGPQENFVFEITLPGYLVKDSDPIEEARLAEEKRLEEERLRAEAIRAEEKRKAEEARLAEEARKKSSSVAAAGNGGIKTLNDGTDVWTVLADCETGDGKVGEPYYANWSYNGPSGFDGAFQFLPSTWSSLKAAAGYSFAWQAPPGVQIAAAVELQARSGWGQWPSCTSRMRAAGIIG